LLAEGDSIVIGNRIKREITVSAGSSYSLAEGSVLTIGRTSPVLILVGDITYTFPFEASGIQMKALFRKEDQNEVRVYVYE
ncbi:hypothetical protein JXB11_01470, partial [Candidatus Woesearchaeota archaeon]|nr:hypothetical protein [Candidatus Woesearchaeota archaeon]